MSLATTLSNAISGLGVVSRGTQIVSENLANIKSQGYARRELHQSAQAYGGNGGGVRIDGVVRIINTSLLTELRLADAAMAEADIRMSFHQAMENIIGGPEDKFGLSSALNELQVSLISANAQPNDTVRLIKIADRAKELTNLLNSASAAIFSEKRKADNAITADVKSLNAGLERVNYLNRRIAIVHGEGADPSALIDERQLVLDKINKIVPIQIAERDLQKVAIFTNGGATLLDGNKPVPVTIKPTVYFGNDVAHANGGERLFVNDKEISESGMSFFAGGSLSAHFEVRDNMTSQLDIELDSFALELHDRFSDPKIDPTITGDKPGLFSDGSTKASQADLAGLAARITINPRIDISKQGELWILQSGVGADTPVPAGDTSQIERFNDAITKFFKSPQDDELSGEITLSTRLAELESHVSTRRIDAQNDSAIRSGRAGTISSRFLADGVDTDTELQRLLQYEQAYAANARVVQAVSEMMDQILRW